MQVKGFLFSLLGLACVSEAYAMPCPSSNNMFNTSNAGNAGNPSNTAIMHNNMHNNVCPRMYIAIESGISIPKTSATDSAMLYGDKSFKVGIPFGAEIGYNFNDSLSAGINFSHRSNKFNSDFSLKDPASMKDVNYTVTQKFKNTAVLLGGKYSFDVKGFSPYIGAGIGATFANAGDYKKSESGPNGDLVESISGRSKMQFAWNVGLGVQKQFGDWSVGLGYRYLDLGKMKTGDFGTISTVVGGKETVSGIRLVDPISTSVRAHEILLSIGYSFR